MKKLITLLMATIMMFALATSAWATNVTVDNATDLATQLAVDDNYITLSNSFSLKTTVEVPADTTVTLDLKGCTITGGSLDSAIENSGMLTITDTSGDGSGVITGTYPLTNSGTCTIVGGTVGTSTSTMAIQNSGDLYISGGSVLANYYTMKNTGSSYSVEISGGTFVGGRIFISDTYTNTVVTAGVFTTSQYATYLYPYIPEDSSVSSIGTTYTVTAATVATIDGTTYASLAEALDKATTDDTVVLVANANLTEVLEIPTGVTLEIGASRTITVSSDGGLTISGTLDNDGVIYNYGTISSGTVTGDGAIMNLESGSCSSAMAGAGTSEDPYEISNAAELKAFLTDSTVVYGELTASFDYNTDDYGVISITAVKDLDLADFKITVTAGTDYPIYLSAGTANLTIYNGEFDAGTADGAIDATGASALMLNVDDVIFYNYIAEKMCIYIPYGKGTVTNSTFYCYNGAGAIDTANYDSYNHYESTVENVTITQTGTNNHASTGVSAAYDSVVNVTDSSIDADGYAFYVYSTGGTINVYDGTYEGDQAVMKTNANDAYINVYGGTFTGVFSEDTGTITIYGGTFIGTGLTQAQFTEYVDQTHSTISSAEDGSGGYTYTVTPEPYLVTIGEVGYYDWSTAIAAAQSSTGSVVTLQQEVTGVTINTETKDYTIDLNGYELTASGSVAYSYRTLTITDGSEDSTGKFIIAADTSITNAGTLNLNCAVENNGTITNNYALYINDGGTLTNNSTLDNNNRLYIDGTVTNSSTGTITNTTTWDNIYVNDGGELINEGMLTNNYCIYVYDGGKLTNKGELDNDYWIAIFDGGTFNNAAGSILNNTDWITIYDGATVSNYGTVNNDCFIEYGYSLETDIFGNESYSSYVSGVVTYYYYGDLNTVITEAGDGDTVVMVKSVEDDITLSGEASLALDLNGCTVDGDITNSGSGTLYIVDGGATGKVIGTISGAVEISGGSYSVDPTSLLASGYAAVLENDYYVVKVDLTQTGVNFGDSEEPYTTIVEGTEYFAEPTIKVTVGEDIVTLTGDFTYSYGNVSGGTYNDVITELQTNKPETTTFTINYSYAVSGDYAGTVTGTITFAYTAEEEVAYTVIGNTIYAKLGDTLLGTFYIAAPTELEYDGSAKEATIVDANSGILGSQTIVYTQNGVICDTPVDAGTYTASVTTQGLTASITFAISRVPVSFTSSNNMFEQGNYNNEPTITPSIDGFGYYTVSYLDADGNEVTLGDETEVGTYTIVVDVTNPNYKLSGTVGSVVVYEVVMPETYELNYDIDGDVTLDSEAIATTVHTLTETTPTKSGHTFAGWAYNGKIYTAGATFVQPEADVTMTATWIVDDMEVTGIVKDAAGNVISGATVTLVEGKTYTTGSDGTYSFSGVAAGTYTISVSYTDGDGITYTSSSEVYIKADTTVNFSLQDLTLSTKVVVEAGLEAKTVSNLSEVAAEILSEQAENGAYSEFTEVEVSLIITSSNDLTAISEIADKTEDVGYTVDISIEKVFDNTVVEAVSETPNTIEIEIALPAEIQGMATYKVYRYHVDENGNGSVDILTTNQNGEEYILPVTTEMTVVGEDGESSLVDVTTSLIIHAKYFSTYAIAATDTVASTGSVKKYSNSLEVGDNGSAYATPLSAASGTTVYINVSPDTGYEVDEVLVDGGDIDVTDEGDGTYSYKQPSYAVEIEVTFVATDGTVEEEVVEEDEAEALTDFEDVVAGAWYEEYIAAAVEEGIMQGNSSTEFAPNGTTTRAMMIQVLFNLEDQPETENDEAAWYSEALAWGMEFGITDGSEITGDLTREQLVTMLYRYAMSNGVDVSIGEDTNILSYNDALDVADWAMDAFQWACGAGIINGDTDGNLNPDGNATRAELAKIMVSYLAL